MKGKHHKHPAIGRPKIGFYHRNEWAIYGTTCEVISQLADAWMDHLSDYKTAYIDADHGVETDDSFVRYGKKQRSCKQPVFRSDYDDMLSTQEVDLVIINGNHYQGKRQLVVIDHKKEASLHRRLDELTNVEIIIISEGESEVYDFLRPKIQAHTKILKISETSKIIDHIRSELLTNQSELKALILAGGRSQRMGVDKSKIIYHGLEQQLHMAELCKSLGLSTYISKRSDYLEDDIMGFAVIKDKVLDMGPFGAILSAMMVDPNASWLVLACDLPYIDADTLQCLIDARDVTKVGTAFRGIGNPYPEPLIAIYEPKAYLRLLSFISLGYTCPRKVLINSDVKLVDIDTEVIINVNEVSHKDEVLNTLKNKS